MKAERRSPITFGDVAPEGPLEKALVAEARDGRLPCGAVFQIASAHGRPVAEAGRAVQRLGIKVTGCQLGCF
jgi:hypothetical protein